MISIIILSISFFVVGFLAGFGCGFSAKVYLSKTDIDDKLADAIGKIDE